jgi:DNA-binding beta-propeller fold protein YncE
VAGWTGIRSAASDGFLLSLAAATVLVACGGTGVQTTATPIPNLGAKPGSFDDVEIDQAAHRLYAADRTDTGVDVFDIAAPAARYMKTIALPAEPNGLALAPDLGRLFAGTAAGAVEVIDTSAGNVAGEIKTGAQEVDLLDYGAAPQRLFAATAAGGTLLTIDARTDKVLSTVNVGKPLEQPRYDPADGMVYVSVPELDALAQVDPDAGTVKKTLKLGGCIPRGLAVRPSSQTAVMACRKMVMVYDLKTGSSKTLGRVADGDIVQYYPSVDRFFVTSPHVRVPTVVGMFGGDPVADLGSLNINGGGNAAAYDQANDLVYTTDPRPGSAGVMSFRMEGSRPVPMLQSLLATVGPWVILAALIGTLWYVLGRSADPIHRKRRGPKPAPDQAPAPKATDRPSLG